MDTERPTTEAVDDIVRGMQPEDLVTLLWFIEEIRKDFGASESFDSQDPKFKELTKRLVAKVFRSAS